MNPFALVVSGLVGMEAVLVALRVQKVIVWKWWMMTPLWLASAILTLDVMALVAAVAVARDLLHWFLP